MYDLKIKSDQRKDFIDRKQIKEEKNQKLSSLERKKKKREEEEKVHQM